MKTKPCYQNPRKQNGIVYIHRNLSIQPNIQRAPCKNLKINCFKLLNINGQKKVYIKKLRPSIQTIGKVWTADRKKKFSAEQ